ncbi:hypothetical protein HPB49_001552 [Dermacentor silvarum]|uniref:Uncharacterized protein n=1 Tax=Dermacentor silvarum TaxID=543639 RepID=A0ACB8D9Y1_DERSI|nr:hypothetical protein HPB49_001552 [Dermacentor silvarum]
MPGGKQSTTPSRRQQGFALCAYSVSVALGTALLLRFLVPKFSLLAERAPADASAFVGATDACCPELQRDLAATVDESVDPCVDFVRYACGDIGKKIRQRDYEDSWFHGKLWLPALTGAAQDDASVLLRQVYLSCARNDFGSKRAFADAGTALRDALNLRSTDALSIPALIVKITASFRIDLFVRVRFVQARTAPSCNIDVSRKAASDIDRQAFEYQGDTARVFELRDSPLNLTPIHLDVLDVMRDAPSDWNQLVTTLKEGDDTDELAVNASSHVGGQMLWRAALALHGLWQPRMQISIDEALLLQRLMQLFMVKWKDMSVIYIFHLSTWSLVSHAMGDRYTLAFPGQWQDSCSRELRQYHYLWAAAAAYRKSSGASDLVIASFIDALLDEVQRESAKLFPDVSLSVKRALNFVIPAELFPQDWSVPNATDSYWANRLMIIGKPPPTTFFVNPTMYANIRDDVGDRFIVNDALFGVDLATWVWAFVLNNVTSQRSANAEEFLSCLENTIKHRTTRQAALFLAIRSILKIRTAVDWDALTLSIGNLKPFSSSKLFYVAFLNQGVCKKALSGLEIETNVRGYADVLRHVANFQNTFKCPPAGVNSEYCFSGEHS